MRVSYSCCLRVVPSSSTAGSHTLRLDMYKICFTGGWQHCRAAGRRHQRATRNVRCAHARASVSTLLLYALGVGGTLSSRTFCARSKADLFAGRSFTPRRRSPLSCITYVGEAATSNSFFLVGFVFPPVMDWLIFLMYLFRGSRPCDIVFSLYVLKRIHSQPQLE